MALKGQTDLLQVNQGMLCPPAAASPRLELALLLRSPNKNGYLGGGGVGVGVASQGLGE